MRFGVIADDVTGGTDLASALRRAGCSVVQTLDVPVAPLPPADAVVVSLKIRTAPVAEATASARRVAEFLTAIGVDQLYFKYCSTFDSTARGNIGPIIETLLDGLRASYTVVCPAYPSLARTVYKGHLFVGAQLLSESSMRDHPLTPMTDANLVRVLAPQTTLRVGLAALEDVEHGPARLRARLEELRAEGVRVVIVDAVFDRHVDAIATACDELPLVTGGAALGAAMGRLRRSPGTLDTQDASPLPPVAILSGSCSAATLMQLDRVPPGIPTRRIDPVALASDTAEIDRVITWACDHVRRGVILVTSTVDPEDVSRAQLTLGRAEAAAVLDTAFGRIAEALAKVGVRTFVVAGGETSGAVLRALGIRVLAFGEEIDPGVPWTYSLDPAGFSFALKSGNFGSPRFFARALGNAA